MLRFEVRERDREPLPALDLDGEVLVGSAVKAQVRLPHTAADEEHVRIADRRWNALADVCVDGADRRARESGEIGDGVVLELGMYRVTIGPSPAGVAASSPQRTESLARELVRAVLGGGEPPMISIESGADAGAIRPLQPPESSLVIGRGDDADWVILDEDLSRVHVEIQRNWDGIWIRDLDSKNGTKVGDAEIGKARFELRDGCVISIGNLKLRFRDPAERHLRAGITRSRPDGSKPPPEPVVAAPPRTIPPTVWIAAIVIGIALAGLIWILSS